MIKTVTFHAETAEPGPRLLVLGAIHGNEICGPAAISRIISEIEGGAFKLKRGRVTFIPVCNPSAYAQNVRFTERNLNRNLVPMEKPDCYEAILGNKLCPYLEDCDVLVDIHSYHIGGAAFIFIDPPDEKNLRFGAALGADWLVSNFSGAIEASGAKKDEGNWAIGTTEYARGKGAMSVTLECGQHRDPQAPEYAYRAIVRALAVLDMLENPPSFLLPQAKHIKLDHCRFYTDQGKFARDWKNFEPVKTGELIAVRASGEELRAPHDGVLVLPRAVPELNHEWYYFGRETSV